MTKGNHNLTINGEEIAPGQQKTLMLKMPELYDWTPLSMPVHVIRGKQPGPTLCVTAAIHGDEVNGVEVVRRLLKRSALKKLTGTLIAVPIVNIYGFLYQNRYLMDRRDLNRCFPGSEKGSLAARLAHLVTTELIAKSTHIIDLHAGSLHRTNLPQIRANIDDAATKDLAHAFNVPVILHAELRDGSMREYATSQGIPFLLYEAGESLRFDEVSIRSGVNGILSVMVALGMLPPQKLATRHIEPTVVRHSYWVRAPRSGVFRPHKGLGKSVKEGEVLATIANPTGREEHKVLVPDSGIIIGKSNFPMTHECAALFHIACYDKPHHVAEQVENLQEVFAEYDVDSL